MLANWVKENTVTAGTGTITLTAITGAVRFNSASGGAFATGQQVYYTIQDGNNRETGIGTVGAGNTLARTTVLETLVSGTWTGTGASAITLSGGLCTVYCDAPAQTLTKPKYGTTVASAATTNIWGVDGDVIDVSGAATITSLGTAPRAGAMRIVRFLAGATLTANANILLPAGVNMTTALGDWGIFVATSTTAAALISYTKSNGQPFFVPGNTIQFLRGDGTYSSTLTGQLTLTGIVSTGPSSYSNTSRITRVPNETYDLSANTLAVQDYFNWGTVTVAANKVNSCVRYEGTYAVGVNAKASPIEFVANNDGTSDANGAVYGIYGGAYLYSTHGSAVKAIYGRGVFKNTSVGGTAIGLVGAVTVEVGATPTNAWAVQVSCAGQAHIGVNIQNDNPGTDSWNQAIVIDNSCTINFAAIQWVQRAGAAADFLLMYNSASNKTFRVDSAGNVYIGAPAGGGSTPRIFADMSNATHSNRLFFQTTTVNSNTIVGAMPNGTATVATWTARNANNPDVSGSISMTITNAVAAIDTNIVGGATQQPFELRMAGAYVIRAEINNDILMGKTGAAAADTSGFMYLQSVNAATTGVPTDRTATGYNPIRYDRLNHKIGVYDGAWKWTAALT